MEKTSATVTGGVAISTATLQPAVTWALGAIFHVPVPDSISVLITGVLAAGVHAALGYLQSRAAKPQ